MDKDQFEINWDEIRSQSSGWWRLMDDHDLAKVDKAPSKRDKFATLLRVKYGYSNDQAKKEIGKLLTKIKTDHKTKMKTAPSGMVAVLGE